MGTARRSQPGRSGPPAPTTRHLSRIAACGWSSTSGKGQTRWPLGSSACAGLAGWHRWWWLSGPATDDGADAWHVARATPAEALQPRAAPTHLRCTPPARSGGSGKCRRDRPEERALEQANVLSSELGEALDIPSLRVPERI